MLYSVTYGNTSAPGPVAIDTCKDLPTAIARACYLLLEGTPNVNIADGDGNQINDDDLARLLQSGEAKLVPDRKPFTLRGLFGLLFG